MLLIKNDPKYNEQWPRALVPYKRIYGIDEPQASRRSPTTASARRTCPRARRSAWSARRASTSARAIRTASVPPGSVTADLRRREGSDRRPRPGRQSANWTRPGRRRRPVRQRRHPRHPHPGAGADDRPRGGPSAAARFYNHARERLRILGEIPVRKFDGRQAAARSRRQPRHQLPGEDSGRRRLHVPDARQARHGAEHGPDLAPGAARRDPQRLRRLPRPQPEADALRGHRRRQARLRRLRPDDTDAAADDQGATTSPARSGTSKDETGLRFANGPCRTSSTTATSSRSSSAAASPATRRSRSKPAGNLVLDDDGIVDATNPVTLGFNDPRARHLLPPGG